MLSVMTRSPPHRLALLLSVVALGCGARAPFSLPPRVSGQLPADSRLQEGRGVILARVTMVTNDRPGFAGISNPLLLQFQPGGDGTDAARTVTLTDSRAFVFAAPSQVPSVWRFEEPGLLAMSITPGTYDGLAIAYPDYSREIVTADSIPAPSSPFAFTPITVQPAGIVYLGDIEIRQRYDLADLLLDRVEVSYAVRDDYDRTVADFRARYPQFADVEVERRVVQAPR
jgi:hypothetical protein